MFIEDNTPNGKVKTKDTEHKNTRITTEDNLSLSTLYLQIV